MCYSNVSLTSFYQEYICCKLSTYNLAVIPRKFLSSLAQMKVACCMLLLCEYQPFCFRINKDKPSDSIYSFCSFACFQSNRHFCFCWALKMFSFASSSLACAPMVWSGSSKPCISAILLHRRLHLRTICRHVFSWHVLWSCVQIVCECTGNDVSCLHITLVLPFPEAHA